MTLTKSYTALKGKALADAHQRLLDRSGMSEAAWLELLFDFGCRFAEVFAKMFPDTEKVRHTLLQHPAKDGLPYNGYWMWWRVKWMLDDEGIMANRCLEQPITYPHLKSYMIGDERLETELLNMIDSMPAASSSVNPQNSIA